MAEITDIKDATPNLELIERLKEMLSQAESGELRSIFYVVGYDTDYTGASWMMDNRTSRNRFIGAITLGATDFTINQLSADRDSALVHVIESASNA